MMLDRIAIVRTLLVCLLVLAAMGLRAPVGEPSGATQVLALTVDHHGHSHDDEDEPSAPSGHDHDRFHIGDHSHDTPTAAVLIGFRFGAPRDQGPGTPDDRVASRPTQPGDRPPRAA